MKTERASLLYELLESLVDVSELLGTEYALRKNDPVGTMVREHPDPFLDAMDLEHIFRYLRALWYADALGFESPEEILKKGFDIDREEVQESYRFLPDNNLDEVVRLLVEDYPIDRILDAVHHYRLIHEPGYSDRSRPRGPEEFDI